jgi:hypothetical protein
MARVYPPRESTKIVGVTLRIREELRAQLEMNSQKHGVSLNAEIERRLQGSFEEENTSSLIRTLVGGATAELLGAIARVFDLEGIWRVYRSEGPEAARARLERAYVALIIIFTELLSTREHPLDPTLANKQLAAMRRGGDLAKFEGAMLAKRVFAGLHRFRHVPDFLTVPDNEVWPSARKKKGTKS